MKILYGIQGTGNGHLTRARALVPALREAGIEMDFIFSGRAKQDYFNMDVFGDEFRCYQGLSLVTANGKLDTFKTITQSHLLTFLLDVKNLNLDAYDLIISDFEPITAWAAKLQNKPSIGISHQCSFKHDIPKAKGYFSAKLLMEIFAPTKINLGLHWHHFGQAILPPLVEKHEFREPIPNKIVVYMPFEELNEVVNFVTPFTKYDFVIYAKTPYIKKLQNIAIKPLSQEFHRDLEDANGVISNAGFELGSECLLLGKKMLVKPLLGQYEQISNVIALVEMQRATIIEWLDQRVLDNWLDLPSHHPIHYPNVAELIAKWIKAGNWDNTEELIQKSWGLTHVNDE